MDFLDRFSEIIGYPSLSEEIPRSLDGYSSTDSMDCLTAPGAALSHEIARSFVLGNDVVLEQSQAFYLLKNARTGLFSIWATGAQAPLFQSANWAAAYRTWLDWIHTQSAHRSVQNQDVQSSESLHDWVHQHCHDPGFGRLLYRRDLSLGGVLQYSVQISEAIAFRWTAGTTPLGILTLDKVSRRQHRLAKWIEPRSQDVIAAALHFAIDIFHQQWVYCLDQFNSEHWAKLIVTGECSCEQKDEILDYRQNMATTADARMMLPEVLPLNLDAQEILKAALATLQPEHFTP
jgi:hypothetical protein